MAVSVLVVGGPLPAVALAVMHLGFAGFVTRLRSVAAGAPCGCFGPADAPADRLHVVVNLAAATVAALAAAGRPESLLATLAGQPALGVPYLALVVVAAGSTLLVLTALPELWAAARRPTAP